MAEEPPCERGSESGICSWRLLIRRLLDVRSDNPFQDLRIFRNHPFPPPQLLELNRRLFPVRNLIPHLNQASQPALELIVRTLLPSHLIQDPGGSKVEKQKIRLPNVCIVQPLRRFLE